MAEATFTKESQLSDINPSAIRRWGTMYERAVERRLAVLKYAIRKLPANIIGDYLLSAGLVTNPEEATHHAEGIKNALQTPP